MNRTKISTIDKLLLLAKLSCYSETVKLANVIIINILSKFN
ncbi:hypothetical protein [uncultured Clostridium sp.]